MPEVGFEVCLPASKDWALNQVSQVNQDKYSVPLEPDGALYCLPLLVSSYWHQHHHSNVVHKPTEHNVTCSQSNSMLMICYVLTGCQLVRNLRI